MRVHMIFLLLFTFCAMALAEDPPPFAHNGKPFFPVGLYHYPGGGEINHFDELGAAGINLMRASINVSTAYLDAASAEGVLVMGYVGPWLADLENRRADLIAQVNRIKGHPALFAYETIDEPHWNHDCYHSGPSLEELVDGYQTIRGIDPDRPMMLNFAPLDLTSAHLVCGATFTLESYIPWTQAGDSFGMDRYPVWGNPYPSEDLNAVNWCCDRLKQIAGPGKTIYMVLQGIGMLEWDADPENDGRRPNWIETRFMAYSSVIHGARGILYWGQYYMTPDSELWTSIKRVASELRDLSGPLAAGETRTRWSAGSPFVEGILKEYKNNLYLVLANRSSVSLSSVNIDLPGIVPSDVAVLFEDRMVAHQGGRFRDAFEPWGVHVYRAAPLAPALLSTR